MTRSTLLGCVAGLLMALDGLEFVLSRTAILDIFVMFWVLAAFGLLVIDRDRTRARLAAAADAGGPADDGGPGLGIRWLRVLAGVCLGCATASKWNGVWYILAFGGLAIAWDLGARRAAGFGRGLSGAARHDAKWLPLWFGLIPAAVYVASWTGWFASADGYNRAGTVLSSHHQHTSAIAAWLAYNKWMLQFGLGLMPSREQRSLPVEPAGPAGASPADLLRLPAARCVGRPGPPSWKYSRSAPADRGRHRGDAVLPVWWLPGGTGGPGRR